MNVFLLSISNNEVPNTFDVTIAFGETVMGFKAVVETHGVINVTRPEANFYSDLAMLGNGLHDKFISNTAFPKVFELVTRVYRGENLSFPINLGNI